MAREGRNTVKVIEQGPWGFFFVLAYIGAAIYFVAHSGGGFWAVILALLKAIVWPVYVVYHVLALLGA